MSRAAAHRLGESVLTPCGKYDSPATHLLLQIEIAMTPTQPRAARALLNWSQKDGRNNYACFHQLRR